tara:strand:- start:1502 stop:1672 length:171 start_codon:yes stop_codon:yes gene_type:complete
MLSAIVALTIAFAETDESIDFLIRDRDMYRLISNFIFDLRVCIYLVLDIENILYIG